MEQHNPHNSYSPEGIQPLFLSRHRYSLHIVSSFLYVYYVNLIVEDEIYFVNQ